MAVDIKIPSVGESVTEGSISRWLKQDGDLVRQDEPLLELETEKATQEIPSPATGKLSVLVKEGRVEIGAIVGSIDEKAAVSSAASKSAVPMATSPTAPAMSPAARRLAAEEGIAPAHVSGSGRHGLVMKEDVQRAVDERTVAPAPVTPSSPAPGIGPATPANGPPRENRVRMSAIRHRIATRLLTSQKTTASLTTFNEVDMSEVMDLRNRYKDRFKEKHEVGLGFMSFFVKAVIEALKAFPAVNAWIDGEEIVYHNYFNVGVAVSTEKGLMVPVLRDADTLSVAQIEKQVGHLAIKAREGKINLADLEGGTFTITNGGVFGSMLSTPILNPPQSGILGMHAITPRPVVRDNQIVIRPMMYLALTYDHRLVDGREAVLFLVRIKECIENPERLLLEV